MTSRRRKTTSPPLSPLIFILIVCSCLALAWILIGSHDKDDTPPGPNSTATSSAPLIDSLLQVQVPQDVARRSQMIHYPGFDVLFSTDDHIPAYVAWELTPAKSQGRIKRSDKFLPDTTVDGCASLDDYRASGYSRGHMAPAADMKWSNQSMDACFLLTNICPQAQQLNAGAWKTAEDSARRWVLTDSTLVIVCGPVLTDRMTRTIGSGKVLVPERFFKVILAPYADPPKAIGFIMPNTRVEGGMQATVVPVDEVERITGYDFFAALPDDIESTVESRASLTQWNKHRRHNANPRR